jgi:hypothetical protein
MTVYVVVLLNKPVKSKHKYVDNGDWLTTGGHRCVASILMDARLWCTVTKQKRYRHVRAINGEIQLSADLCEVITHTGNFHLIIG